jgi:hypothetical protein
MTLIQKLTEDWNNIQTMENVVAKGMISETYGGIDIPLESIADEMNIKEMMNMSNEHIDIQEFLRDVNRTKELLSDNTLDSLLGIYWDAAKELSRIRDELKTMEPIKESTSTILDKKLLIQSLSGSTQREHIPNWLSLIQDNSELLDVLITNKLKWPSIKQWDEILSSRYLQFPAIYEGIPQGDKVVCSGEVTLISAKRLHATQRPLGSGYVIDRMKESDRLQVLASIEAYGPIAYEEMIDSISASYANTLSILDAKVKTKYHTYYKLIISGNVHDALIAPLIIFGGTVSVYDGLLRWAKAS